MIVKLEKESNYLETLEKIFPNVFTKEAVNQELKINRFTNYFTYIIDDNPIAFINYYTMYERAELININVKTEYQNQKIATKLLTHMIDDCTQKQIKSITLEVKEDNLNAIHLYEKFGFEKVSIRKGYYQGIDGILMEKELM